MELSKTRIPLELIQTYHSDTIHPEIQDNVTRILQNNPGCSYRLITDDIGVDLIETHFDDSVLQAYRRLALGAARGDFLRYVALYVYGGIYLDLDSSIHFNITLFLRVHEDPSFVFFYDGAENIIQWCFMVAPRQKIMRDIIEEMVLRIQQGEDNIFLATGPTLVTDVWYHYLTQKKVYNVSRKLSQKKRTEAWALCSSLPSNEKGILLLEPQGLVFRFQGYRSDMLYSNDRPKYIPTWNRPTPGFFLDA